MEQLEQQLLLFISQLYDAIGWPGVVVLSAIESANIPVPSEIIMPLSGWMLVRDKGLALEYTAVAGFYGALGNTIGSVVSYWIGAKGGRPFIERYGRYVLISHHDLALADRWFRKYGDFAIFFSRLLPVVRTFISFPAGVARMPFVKFVVYTFLGAFLWCWALAFGGYQLGEHWEQLRAVMRPFDIPIIVLGLVLVGLFFYRHLRRGTRGVPAEVAIEDPKGENP